MGKGAHTPDCFPDKIRPQIEESLSRGNIDKLDIYCLHRDNLDVPVTEFIDALNDCKKDGLIDVIVSDHLPEDEESKRLPFSQAATGAIGVETLLPLSLEMYHNESLPLNKIIETLTINPAKILNIKKGTLIKGSDGDICIFDLEAPWKVNADKLKSKSKNTAIENRNLQGKILMTYLNGELVYSK